MLSYKEAPPPPRDPAKSFGTLTVPGTKVGAIVSLGLVVICWYALPLSHIFYSGHRRPGPDPRLAALLEASPLMRSNAAHVFICGDAMCMTLRAA